MCRGPKILDLAGIEAFTRIWPRRDASKIGGNRDWGRLERAKPASGGLGFGPVPERVTERAHDHRDSLFDGAITRQPAELLARLRAVHLWTGRVGLHRPGAEHRNQFLFGDGTWLRRAHFPRNERFQFTYRRRAVVRKEIVVAPAHTERRGGPFAHAVHGE